MSGATLSPTERRDRLRLARSENVGPVTFRKILERYPTAAGAIEALPELSRRGGLRRTPKIATQDDIDAEIEHAESLGARHIVLGEDSYPVRLAQIGDAPAALCVMGDLALFGNPLIGIVGARNASALGRRFARTLAAELGAAGFVVVSGLARGIDTAAHDASLETGTIAVLAGGIDVVYPFENEALQRAIGERGLLVTEMPPGAEPRAKLFPRRNRIISGLSLGVAVIEAARRSGSLITARRALEQGREVFAVPGSPLDPRSDGTNGLIRDGAHLLTSATDITEVIAPMLERTVTAPPLGLEEPAPAETDIGDEDRDRILALLGPGPTDIDDLIRESELAAGAVQTVILELELAGRVTRTDGRHIALRDV